MLGRVLLYSVALWLVVFVAAYLWAGWFAVAIVGGIVGVLALMLMVAGAWGGLSE